MPVRVIAGTAKGRRLQMVPGDSTRPVMDRVKEACFSIIGRGIIDALFLDLYAGTGSVGIEALSRGASKAVFVETNNMAIQTIQANLKLTKLEDRAVIRRTDVLQFLKSQASTPYDFIYIAPPQFKGHWLTAMQTLDSFPGWLGPETTVIVQIDPTEKQAAEFQHLTPYDERRYGKTLLWFFAPPDALTDEE
jgi:16S rRNA (guanine966-N2)-methyltransferase